MTFPQDETTKVRLAFVRPSPTSKGWQLKVSTVNKVDLDFHLDDAAVALLSFTAHFAAKEIAAKTDVNKDDLYIFPKEEEIK